MFVKLMQLCAALSLLAVAVPAAAQRPGLDAYLAAADRFDALAAEAQARGAPPRRSEPEAAALLARLSDATATFGGAPFELGDLQPLLLVAQRSIGISNHYVGFGVDPSTPAATAIQAQSANMVRYQDELVPLLVFSVDTMGVLAPLVATMLDQSPSISDVQRTAVAGMRGGVARSINGAIIMTSETPIRPEHRLSAIAAIVRNAPQLVPSLGLTQREPLRALATQYRAHAGPQARSQLDSLIVALGSRECNRLCSL
jgi:hypothetical protein